ncbi:MFS family permease [Rhizobium leguminosarum]|nr:hypothetical protein [Rhizobium leguminosarum]MBB5667736.1 MFS family permease [Rhizobium leguminosarum]
MANTSAPSGNTDWTLADFLSTYRYWALFLSSLLLAIGGQGLSTVLPLISQMTGSSAQTIGIFYSGSTLGWGVGAFLAFVVASRQARSALIYPLVICAVVAISFLPAPALWGSPSFLFLFGLALGAVRAVFPLAIAIFLVSGRPGKIDFGCALTLMSTTILISAVDRRFVVERTRSKWSARRLGFPGLPARRCHTAAAGRAPDLR